MTTTPSTTELLTLDEDLGPHDPYDSFPFEDLLPDRRWFGGRKGYITQFDDYELTNSWEWTRRIGQGYRVGEYGPYVNSDREAVLTATAIKSYGKGRRVYSASIKLRVGHYIEEQPRSYQNQRFSSIREILAWADAFLKSGDFATAYYFLRQRALSNRRAICVYRKDGEEWVPYCSWFHIGDNYTRQWPTGDYRCLCPTGQEYTPNPRRDEI